MKDVDRQLDAELSRALRARGHRVTMPRLLVHRQVRQGPRHLTAEHVHTTLAAEMPSLSLATVYSTLEMLEGLGFVRRINTPHGPSIYDSRTDAHHHAFCTRCGEISDVDAGSRLRAARDAALAQGFVVEHAEVQLSGLCPACVAATGD